MMVVVVVVVEWKMKVGWAAAAARGATRAQRSPHTKTTETPSMRCPPSAAPLLRPERGRVHTAGPHSESLCVLHPLSQPYLRAGDHAADICGLLTKNDERHQRAASSCCCCGLLPRLQRPLARLSHRGGRHHPRIAMGRAYTMGLAVYRGTQTADSIGCCSMPPQLVPAVKIRQQRATTLEQKQSRSLTACAVILFSKLAAGAGKRRRFPPPPRRRRPGRLDSAVNNRRPPAVLPSSIRPAALLP